MNKSPARSRGTTLVEILVSTSIFLLFLGIVFGLFLFGYRSWKKAEVKTQNERTAVLMIEEITRGLIHSNERSVSVVYYSSLAPFNRDLSNPPVSDACAVSFLTPFDDTGTFVGDTATDDPIWQAYVVYYLNPDDKTIRRKRIELPAELRKQGLTEKEKDTLGYGDPIKFADLQPTLDGAGVIVASEVTKFKLLDIKDDPMLPTNVIVNPMCVQVCVRRASVTDDEKSLETIEVTRLVRLFN